MVRFKSTVTCLVTVIVVLFVQMAVAGGMATDQVIVYNALGEPSSIDPGISMGEQVATLAMMGFEGLTRLNADNVRVSRTARS